MGGLAVILHGYLRATADLDLAIGLSPDNAGRGMRALASIGLQPRLPVAMDDFADEDRRLDWLRNRNMADPGRRAGGRLVNPSPSSSLEFGFKDAERAQLMDWVRLSAGAKIDFFEEMVELAYRSGALAPERLTLRDRPAPQPSPDGR
ncbi:hypothetical protein [Luteimonas sp. R10]|uniref:hypothetical protein n=1 Tax=Luteimonas sp. R10 TaxID=3108176 RepID=UPI00308ADDC2|nr:hypothetical protein U3649_15050 [Luteimonas sp. R10]